MLFTICICLFHVLYNILILMFELKIVEYTYSIFYFVQIRVYTRYIINDTFIYYVVHVLFNDNNYAVHS